VRLPPTDWVGKVQGFRSSEQDAEEAMEEMENTRKKQPWMDSDASPCALGSQQEAAKRSQFFEDRIGCRQATGLDILGGPVFRKASASRSQSAGTTNTSCLHGVASKLTRDSSPRTLRKGLGRVAYSNVLLFVPRRYLRNPFDNLKLCRVRKPTIPNPYTTSASLKMVSYSTRRCASPSCPLFGIETGARNVGRWSFCTQYHAAQH
jgi:hypothetical protein